MAESITTRNSKQGLRDLIEHTGVRLIILLVMHTVLFVGLLWLAMLLRFDFQIPAHMMDRFRTSVAAIVSVKIVVFYLAGHFHGWYRYVSFSDVLALGRAALLAMLAVAALDYFVFQQPLPRTVILLDFLLTICATGLLRSVWRLYDERTLLTFSNNHINNALMVGTSPQDGKLAHQINSQKTSGIRIKALVAVGEFRRGSRLGNLRVRGSMDKVHSIALKHNCTHVLVSNNTLSGTQLRQLNDLCAEHGLQVRILPQMDEVMQGAKKIPLRELNISDLLRREPAQLDEKRIGNTVRGKRILVTGAGGSIGSEICRQLLKFNPHEIVLLGRGENRIFAINQELSGKAGSTKLTTAIADVTNKVSMRGVFEKHDPELVFHAAAHKHVFLMEGHVAEAITNNAHGTRVTADLAIEFGVERFVLISTDKAVNPTSVMGCSKQLAERVIHSRALSSDTIFGVVRFGNVLGSNGSVIPIFQEQIRNGGPITITDPNMTRYFMSIPEASQLVLQAGSMCTGGEVFCLDMGKPMRIVDLAKDLIHLSGLPQDSIEIEFMGARTGEKLYEELYFDEEATIETDHEKVRAAYQRPYEGTAIDDVLDEVLQQRGTVSNEELKDQLKELIPEYRRPLRHDTPSKAVTKS
ncbi:UDP-N-acetylglucosamine 4,6-dehydratase family protein [Rubripirellula obstinata]|nr:nucleoside-diphosphate sugar epimerase/dehydratase [Rubripirellula obstinata]